jgi:lambda repressor-like predicted transcriptional regulator
MSQKTQKQKDEEALKDILKPDPKRVEKAKKVIGEMIRAPEPNLWPGRYFVTAKLKEYMHRNYIFKDVEMTIFQWDMPEEEAISLLVPLDFTPGSSGDWWQYAISQAEETFSEEQAKELIPFLEQYPGTQVDIKPATMPIEHGIGVGAISVGGFSDFYLFFEEAGYSLGFKVVGYYNLESCEFEPNPDPKATLKEEETDKAMRYLSSLSLEDLLEVKEFIDKKIQVQKAKYRNK